MAIKSRCITQCPAGPAACKLDWFPSPCECTTAATTLTAPAQALEAGADDTTTRRRART